MNEYQNEGDDRTATISDENNEQGEFIHYIGTLKKAELEVLISQLFNVTTDIQISLEERIVALRKIELISKYTNHFNFNYFDVLLQCILSPDYDISQIAANVIIITITNSTHFGEEMFLNSVIHKFIDQFSKRFDDILLQILKSLCKIPTLADKFAILGLIGVIQKYYYECLQNIHSSDKKVSSEALTSIHDIISIYLELIKNIQKDIAIIPGMLQDISHLMNILIYYQFPDLFLDSLCFISELMPIVSQFIDNDTINMVSLAVEIVDLFEKVDSEMATIFCRFYESISILKYRDELAQSVISDVILEFYNTWKLTPESFSCLSKFFTCILPVKADIAGRIVDSGLIYKFVQCYDSGEPKIVSRITEFFAMCCHPPFIESVAEVVINNKIIEEIASVLITFPKGDKRIGKIMDGLCSLLTYSKSIGAFEKDDPLISQFLQPDFQDFIESKSELKETDEIYYAIAFLEKNIDELEEM
ncbi:hypothetical protein TVAG_194700 [Trichomonas vaginalis G3]|uniref:Uncharacterized protein n=1 Tax=Trichomonas vaginalis (strain ATCC PRA-98 / G3) TaxID=412133 RepID=A2FL13_TRIV3|nr:armadillo (ARM) repeat-containing protein family [Trichomonas vaginalis G3]EAX94384.1 hypothetical protein TVAG_194700 [Trichomonas vaginalis G3]KAI5494002.1 armadillo (ARM) repeat-containing protein family [Trichomonas vaginalis G3]|eukprot:XP_001307314.1 hypothetical protein [Trichomonas vaginalis G3]